MGILEACQPSQYYQRDLRECQSVDGDGIGDDTGDGG